MKARHLQATQSALHSLARTCVKNGFGIAAVELVLRRAFAIAASERCQLATGRPNHAHINAATGLPRSVIRSLLRGESSRAVENSLSDSTPAAKVLVLLASRPDKPSEIEDDDRVFRRLQRKLALDSTYKARAKEIH
jgi:hypothetical protein